LRSKGRQKLGQPKICPTSKTANLANFFLNKLLLNIRADIGKQIDMH